MTEDVAIYWRRDPEAEEKMQSLGLEWDWVDGLDPQTAFAQRESLANQGRRGDVNSDTVNLYAEKMRAGTSFPGIIARKGGTKNTFIYVGGNHRHQAAARVGGKVSGYILKDADIPSAALLTLTWWDNGRHGLPATKAELKQQAVQLVDLGMTHTDAAKEVGLKTPEVAVAVKDRNATRTAKTSGLDMKRWDSLPVTLRRALHGIRTKQGFTALTKLVMEASLTAAQAEEAITEMNMSNDSDEHLKFVSELEVIYKKQRAQRRGDTDMRGAKTRTPRSIFVGSLRTIARLDAEVIASHYDGRVARDSACQEIEELVTHLGVIKRELSQ